MNEMNKKKKGLNTDMALALKKLDENLFKKCRQFLEKHSNDRASHILEALVAVLRSYT